MFMDKKTILPRCQFFPAWSLDSISSNQNPSELFYWYNQMDSKVYMEKPKTHNSQHHTKEVQVGGLMLPFFKTYYTAIGIKAVWY